MFTRLGAQQYFVSSIPYTPYSYVQGVPVVYNIDDTWSDTIPVGFDFYFFGQHYNQLVVGTNGVVSFNLSYANQYCQWPINAGIPSPSLPTHSIMFPFQDTDPGQGGTIAHQVYGTPPNRAFVLSFSNVPMFSCNNLLHTSQLVLYETSNNIDIFIENKPLCPNWNAGAAILGIQDSATAYVVPGRNFPTQWTAQNEGWRFAPDAIPVLNRITGQHYVDLDADCVNNGIDYPLWGQAVLINGGAQYGYTDMLGYYSVLTDTGTYDVTSPAPLYYTNACPVGGLYNVVFPTLGDSADHRDFADTVAIHCADLAVDLGSIGLRACDTSMLYMTVQNTGTMPDTAVTVVLTLNDSTQILTSPVPYTALGNNQYSFSLGTIIPSFTQTVALEILVGCDTLGTVYCYAADVTGVFAECNAANNHNDYCSQLVNAYDPNGISVAAQDFAQRGFVTYDEIDGSDELTYRIDFQNTGNAEAQEVRLVDVIPAELDPATIQMGASSHQYFWVLINGVLHIDFLSINLPDSNTNEPASHGFVTFSIRQRPGNGPGTSILNRADIYFDANPPILTNDAENVIPVVIGVNNIAPSALRLFPNPASTNLRVTWEDGQLSGNLRWETVNLLGEVLNTGTATAPNFSVDVNSLSKGVYFLRLSDENGKSVVGKFVVN